MGTASCPKSITAKVVPADQTIEQLKKDAEDCQQRANKAPEPLATRLREQAELLREWMKSLKTGAWKS